MTDDLFPIIEAAVEDLMKAFEVSEPPVPVEIMLQRPKNGMWKEVNLAQLSMSAMNPAQHFGPRMSITRLLVRSVVRSEWGEQRKLPLVVKTEETLRVLARAVLMPRSMLEHLPAPSRVPITISLRFEVPEEDARQRLQDLGYLLSDAAPPPSVS